MGRLCMRKKFNTHNLPHGVRRSIPPPLLSLPLTPFTTSSYLSLHSSSISSFSPRRQPLPYTPSQRKKLVTSHVFSYTLHSSSMSQDTFYTKELTSPLYSASTTKVVNFSYVKGRSDHSASYLLGTTTHNICYWINKNYTSRTGRWVGSIETKNKDRYHWQNCEGADLSKRSLVFREVIADVTE